MIGTGEEGVAFRKAVKGQCPKADPLIGLFRKEAVEPCKTKGICVQTDVTHLPDTETAVQETGEES